jgi:CelD/BcsL family acetyltransferase involved in cellulose biosynthesis
VLALDDAGQPVALLPLIRGAYAGISTAGFIGAKDSNANLGLFADPSVWHAPWLRRLLEQTATAAGLDLFAFRHQPNRWRGQANPLLALPHQRSPSGSRSGRLTGDPDRTLAIRLSKHARKLLRQKEARLEQSGPVQHRRALTNGEVDSVVDAYLAQKTARAGNTGVPAPSAEQIAFLRKGARPDDMGLAIEWHALWSGSDIVATFAGVGHQGHFCGMVLAFEARPDLARCSPGEILIKHVMIDLSRRGFSSFDLGAGEARYKATFCDTADELYDSFLGMSVKGKAAAMMLTGFGHAKRRAKSSDLISRSVRQLRTMRQAAAGTVSSPQ